MQKMPYSGKIVMLKKILFVFIIFFIATSSTMAQVNIGLFGGINSTNFNGDDPPNANFESDLGYDLGATADFYFIDDIALNIQPMYSHQFTFLQYDVNYQYDKYDSISVKSDYFEIPINIKVFANNNIGYVTAGISLAIPLSANSINNRTGHQEDIIERYEPYILIANFGVGVQFSIGKPMIFIEFQYSQSLTNLTKIDILEITINNKLKTNSIKLHTGILFTL
jgi:hypothetical protein